ncbi:hypothetical protein CDG81_20405 [Actinopolyspora erythraea]|uniref:Uncharacterized protein n=1 Tax=Actinopolyspora erythraea TaxID=414996 RepID=A0A099D944_9ACTN|nr:hypothetical protein [Actinopolyspora erythraea]ASU80242.1 hypothetical protein CDG81_20405 [Actinopolyspora erythraea]KGI82678.1 hypothetical protein IL38_04475 [Actinopolyspora erythraea]
MTWLFTQVWLWSVAAFSVGAAVTWLLFVRPAHQQLRELRERAFPEGDIPVWDSESVPEREVHRDTEAWPVAEDGTVREAGPDSGVERTAHLPETSAETAPAGGSEWPTESVPRPLGSQRARWMAAASEDFGGSVFAAPVGGGTASRGNEAAEWQPVQETSGGTETVSFEDADLRLEREREQREGRSRPRLGAEAASGAAKPTAPAEVGSGSERSGAERDNTWFTATEFDMYDTDSVASGPSAPRAEGNEHGSRQDVARETEAAGGGEGELTGRLRSLFEPMVTPGIDPDRSGAELPPTAGEPATDGAASSPAAEELTGEPTHSAPGSAAESPADRKAAEELPRRVPGAHTRPRAQPADSVITGNVLGGRGSETREGAENAPSGTTPQEWYPDERYPEQPRPDSGYTVKGQFDSRQYHTEESPYFDRVVAEVWFRSAGDAEQAGFVAWDGRSRA